MLFQFLDSVWLFGHCICTQPPQSVYGHFESRTLRRYENTGFPRFIHRSFISYFAFAFSPRAHTVGFLLLPELLLRRKTFPLLLAAHFGGTIGHSPSFSQPPLNLPTFLYIHSNMLSASLLSKASSRLATMAADHASLDRAPIIGAAIGIRRR